MRLSGAWDTVWRATDDKTDLLLHLFVAFGVFLASLALIMGILYGYFTKVQQAQLKMQTMLAAQGVSNEGAGYFQGLDIQHYRITWIGADGAVLYDSQSVTGENHLAREEVVQAPAFQPAPAYHGPPAHFWTPPEYVDLVSDDDDIGGH